MRTFGRATILAVLLACVPLAAPAEEPTASGSFSRQIPGTDRREPITNATFADHVYFELRILADSGEHTLQLSVYDGGGREVYNGQATITVTAGGAYRAFAYGFDPIRDSPGTWWYVAAVDGVIVLSSSLNVSR